MIYSDTQESLPDIKVAYEIRLIPWRIKALARTWLAAWEGWILSQNTYWVALGQVPGDFGLHNNDVVSTVPVPQQPLLASAKPASITTIDKKIKQFSSSYCK